MNYSISDFIGNIGVFLIIVSYLLLQLKKICSDDIKFSILNLVGAALVIISLIQNFNMSAFVIEAFWVGISIVGILKNFKKNIQKKYLNILSNNRLGDLISSQILNEIL